MNKFIKTIYAVAIAGMSVSCGNFLDIVPDNVAVIEHAFTSEVEAEKYLATCYSYMPGHGNPKTNLAMFAGDEIWLNKLYDHIGAYSWYSIAQAQRTPDNTTPDFWTGGGGIHCMFNGIRECNTFIEKMLDESNAPDLDPGRRARWIAEVKCLKAFYHFYLLRNYGPIPIVDTNLPLATDPADVQVYRQPFDECVKYISNLLDECYLDLPLVIYNRQSELGRITRPINRAIKTRLLMLAASPLFNGNPDYVGFVDNRGVALFPEEYDHEKWKLAADAALEAIQCAESAGHKLYYFKNPPFPLSETTMTQMNIRMAVCDRENDEVIWGLTNSRATNTLQAGCMAFVEENISRHYVRASIAPTMAIVEQYYTKNGVPITEDRTLNFSNPAELRVATLSDMYNIEPGYTTARINFDRENRFYASIGFDGGKWIMENHPSRNDAGNYTLKCKANQVGYYGGAGGATSSTGYFTKKLVHWKGDFHVTNGTGAYEYAFPEIRLAEIYLSYSEALNEYSGPSDDVYKYIDLVRERAGLSGVIVSWNRFSTNPSKPTTKEGLRDIVQRERLIELALEGQRYWDILRWKQGHRYLNAPIIGWNITQEEPEAYYQHIVLYDRKFVSPRDYLAPIPNKEINVNKNVIQNPGW